jgi:hypothetical protein
MINQPMVPSAYADPISAYNVEHEMLNAGQDSLEAEEVALVTYRAALQRMDDYEPTTDRDFVRKFVATWKDDASPSFERTQAMLDTATRLLEPTPQTAWSTMMGSYLAVKARDDAFMDEHYMPHFNQRQADKSHVIPDDIEQAAEALGDHKSDLQDALMAMPAPDAAALMWKLDIAFRVDQDGSLEPLSGWYISQTISDYHQMLRAK